MFDSIVKLWQVVSTPAKRELKPAPTWWRVAKCSAYNSPPAMILDVYATHYGQALEEAELVPQKYWRRDTSVKWAENWEGMQAWKITDQS